jgi:DHA1 family tetracycline resistance protein-like MFS transporter
LKANNQENPAKRQGLRSFTVWGRNGKVLVLTEIFWSVPMSWVLFYRPIFLNESIGLSAVQIGLLSSVLTFSSIISPLAGGYLADRFGRKRVFMLFDSFGWLSSLTVWYITRNMWYALAAYILESLISIIYPVWECMLVEDTAPKHRASIYGSISVATNIGALLTPIAGCIIGSYGLDSGTRTLFIIAFASMVPMFTIRQALLRETELGRQIMKEKSFAGLKGYADSFSIMRRNRIITALVATTILGTFYNAATTYLPLYLTHNNGLSLGEDVASLVPAALSTSALLIASLIVPRLSTRSGYVKTLSLGFGLGCLALLFLSFTPKGSLPFALVSGAILGCYSTIGYSVSRTFLTNEIEAANTKARAKILSITVTLSSLLGLPGPVLMGYLFSLDPKLPFIAVSGVLMASLAILLVATRKRDS